MSIVLAIACQDGIVIVGDRRSSRQVNGEFEVLRDDVRKVGVIGRRFIFGVTGRGVIDYRDAARVVGGFAAWAPAISRSRRERLGLDQPRISVRAAALRSQAELGRLLKDDWIRLHSEGEPVAVDSIHGIEVLIAGYDTNGIGKLFTVRVDPTGHYGEPPRSFVTTRQPGMQWSGETEVPRRLLLREGWQECVMIPGLRENSLELCSRPISFARLSVRDATALGVFIVRRAIAEGRPTIGGGVDTVVVSREGIIGPVSLSEEEMSERISYLE